MQSEEALVERLAGVVGATHVMAGTDASAYAVDGKAPTVAVFPGSAEEVSAVMALASSQGLRVAPRGHGTKSALGGVPERVDLALVLSRLNQVVDYVPEDMTATFQAGMLLKDAQAVLGRQGQWIALDPPYADRASIGGVLATNSSGPRRLRYGAARDFLIAIRVVHADGKITKGGAKVVKNVTGYDIPKLHVGALGTLGIIAEATFRLYPVPPEEQTYLAPFPTVDAAHRVVAQLLDSSLVPTAVELLDREAAQKVAAVVGIPWRGGDYGLAIAIGSVREAVEAQMTALHDSCAGGGSSGGQVLDGEAHPALWQAVRNFAFGGGQRAVLKASVLLGKVGDALKAGEEAAAKGGLRLATVSEAGSGILRFYLAGDEPERFRHGLAQTVTTLRTFAQTAGGSLIILEAPPHLKTALDVWGPVGTALPLMQGLKAQFDPQRILNPGRFVGGL